MSISLSGWPLGHVACNERPKRLEARFGRGVGGFYLGCHLGGCPDVSSRKDLDDSGLCLGIRGAALGPVERCFSVLHCGGVLIDSEQLEGVKNNKRII